MKKQDTILVVDDNEINRDVLEGLIESLGHKALTVASGREALDLLGKNPKPDMVLLDILMPEMNGYDVLEFIKQDESLRSLPVIMISVVDEIESVVKCIEAGADDYLTKPFNAILLKARINACLERKRQYDQEQKFHFWLAESYQKLQKAEEIKETVFQMVIHDMNNPLTVILWGLDHLTLEGVKKGYDQQALDLIATIQNGAGQIHELVKSILDVSEMEQGGLKIVSEPLDAVEVVRNVSYLFQQEVLQKNGSLTIHASLDKVECHTDRVLLARVVQNLLANALKYGMENAEPEIRLSVAEKDGKVLISVCDNGPGIPEEQRDKIFTKFYQVNQKRKGLGLGLAFCGMAAEAMGGTIGVENIPSGGCSFCLTLDAR